MAQFQYRAADPEGKVVEGTIEAAEAAAVVARLQDRGLIPIRVGAATEGKAKGKEAVAARAAEHAGVPAPARPIATCWS